MLDLALPMELVSRERFCQMVELSLYGKSGKALEYCQHLYQIQDTRGKAECGGSQSVFFQRLHRNSTTWLLWF
tara:strand:+ start:629 stop:847 length:219 start_codon:yes stop_codon:yes gene_type:complete